MRFFVPQNDSNIFLSRVENEEMKNIAIVLAGGSSQRCGFDKLFENKLGIPVIEQTLSVFQKSEVIDEVIVVLSMANFARGGKLRDRFDKVTKVLPGGDERFESFRGAMDYVYQAYGENVRLVVHNGANPNLSLEDLSAGITLAEKQKNVIFGYFSPNSIKQVRDGKVEQFLDRSEIFETQTPQISDKDTFVRAIEHYSELERTNFVPNDEAELISMVGEEISVYECSPSNTKVTYASDFSGMGNGRIGVGEDSHRFADKFDPEKPFRLAGVDMSEGKLTSDGNSDGDIILHSLCNALLSAVGDKTFDPIAAPICKAGDTNSLSYWQATRDHVRQSHGDFKIKQIVVSLEGAQPRLSGKHEVIQKALAELLSLDIDKVGLTYTTGEGLTDFGEGLGMRSLVTLVIE